VDQFLTASGALALVKAIIDFLKYLRARDTNGWLTQLTVWVAGVAVVLLIRYSDFASSFTLGVGVSLYGAAWGTTILAGLGLGSAAALVNDVKKAIDSSDSAAKPDLVPGATPKP
jgi:hypothetical protein